MQLLTDIVVDVLQHKRNPAILQQDGKHNILVGGCSSSQTANLCNNLALNQLPFSCTKSSRPRAVAVTCVLADAPRAQPTAFRDRDRVEAPSGLDELQHLCSNVPIVLEAGSHQKAT